MTVRNVLVGGDFGKAWGIFLRFARTLKPGGIVEGGVRLIRVCG